MKKIQLLALSALLVGSLAVGAIGDKAKITGKVGNITKNDVEIETETGIVDVPKSMIPSKTNLRPGQTVSVDVNLADVTAYNISKHKKAAAKK